MTAANHVEMLKKIPTVRFAGQINADGTVLLSAREHSGGFLQFIRRPDDTDIKGANVRELFAKDDILVDDWMQFILKMHADHKDRLYDARDGNLVAQRTLQYLQTIKGWAGVEVEYDLAGGGVKVAFSPPRDAVTKIGVQHLMALKQSLWLDSFVENNGTWEIDLPAQSIFLSRDMARTLRFADDATIVPLARFLATVHPDDLPVVQKALDNVQYTAASVYNRTILEDGTLLHFNSFGIPGYNRDGELTRIIGRSRNITGIQQAAEQLSMSEQRFRGIVENSQDLFAVLNPDAVITYVSPAVTAIAGYQAEDVVGHKFNDFVAFKDELIQMEAHFGQVLRQQAKTRGEYLIKHADGRTLWFQIRLSGIVDASGQVAELAAVCHDITEEKKREENLRYLSQHDSLTGAYNRYYFESEMERIEEQGLLGVGLILTDLNGLKLVNDAYGNRRGDELLKEAAALLEQVCGQRHSVFRVGGDEFAILATGVTPEEMDDICGRIEEACKKTQKRPIPVNVSWGTAFRARADQEMQQLYNQAESSMYSNKMLDSSSMRSHVLSSLKETLRSRNLETADHTRRMENMVTAVGKKMGLTPTEFYQLSLLASMHDIGKVAIPDNVINKPGKLDSDEWEVMRTHSEIGARIATTAQEMSIISNEIACHHERWDGTGYPFGMKGEEIPLLSRIISVVDSYDVMTHKRVYKDAMPHEEAIAELKRCAGTQFDPTVAGLFVEIFGELSQEEMAQLLETMA